MSQFTLNGRHFSLADGGLFWSFDEICEFAGRPDTSTVSFSLGGRSGTLLRGQVLHITAGMIISVGVTGAA